MAGPQQTDRKNPAGLFDGFDVLRVAVNGDVVAPPVNLNVEQRLEVLNILVVNAEERFQASGWKLDLLQMTTTISLLVNVLAEVFEE